MAYVKDYAIPDAQNEYVCWMDIMGTKNKMEGSVKTCAIFIFKLHAVVLEVVHKGYRIHAYPVMDGVYLTSESILDLQKTLFYINSELAKLFVDEKEFHHKFLIKTSVAFGPVIHGSNVDSTINREFESEEEYKKSLLLGLPMIQANVGEKDAPPFGVFIHESARAFSPDTKKHFTFKWWKWFLFGDEKWEKERINQLSTAINEYFDTCTKLTYLLDYPKEKIDSHREAAQQYFFEA